MATVTFASGESDQPAAAAEKEMVLDPSTGEMVTAPEYGGTIRPIVALKPEGIDPYYRYTAGFWIGLVNETLGIGDWTFDRSVFAFDTLYMPDEVLTGHLAKSWETPDPLTYVFKLRDDVFWHDKAPVNGRRLTAHDVEYTWQRVLGLSGGEPSADIAGVGDLAKISFDSITATNDSTVVFKLSQPSLVALRSMLVGEHTYVIAREVVEQFGDIQDWRNVVGTGPYELTDVAEGSTWTYTKNEDYWGTDPKYPEYRLPYADKVEYVMVNDPAARLSLLRTGQGDILAFAFLLTSHQYRPGGQSAEDQSRLGAAPVFLSRGNGVQFQQPEGALERHPRAPGPQHGCRRRVHRRELPAVCPGHAAVRRCRQTCRCPLADGNLLVTYRR